MNDNLCEKTMITCSFVCLFYGLNHIQLQWIYKTIDIPIPLTYSHESEQTNRFSYFFGCTEDDRIIFIKWVLIFHIYINYCHSNLFILSFMAFILHLRFNWCCAGRFIIENIVKPQVVGSWCGAKSKIEKKWKKNKNACDICTIRVSMQSYKCALHTV